MAVREINVDSQDYEVRKDFRGLAEHLGKEGYKITDFGGESFDNERTGFLILSPKDKKFRKSCAVGDVHMSKNSNIHIKIYGLRNYEKILQIAKEFETKTKIGRDIELELTNDGPKYFRKGIDTL